MMLESELEVVHGLTQYGWRCSLGVEIGIAPSKEGQNFRRSPPASLVVLGFAKRLVNHLHQIDRSLIGHIFLNQRLYLVVVQPESFTAIEQMQGLGIELAMFEIIRKVDVLACRNAHADETSRTRGIHQWLLLIGGADERGITTILLDGFAVGRTELDVGRRQQIFQHNLLRVGGLVELVDVDERKRRQRNVQVELVLEVQLVVVVIAQFWRQQNLAETRLATTLTTNKRSLFCNKGTLLVNKRILFPSGHKTAGSVFIPKLGMFYSQAGNISFPRWE